MGYINLPSLDDITQIKDPRQQMEALLNTVGILMKSLTEINGYLESKNIKEVGGYRVNDTDLASKDGDVGMSSANDAADPIRFWAGAPVKENAPFRVPKSGKMVATGATLQSAATYPRIEMDPVGNLLKAAQDQNKYILISPFSGGTPALQFYDGSFSEFMLMYLDGVNNKFSMGASTGVDLISQSGALYLGGVSVRVPKWAQFVDDTTGKNMQTELDAKANKSAISKTVYVSATSGGAATTPMTITNGVVTG